MFAASKLSRHALLLASSIILCVFLLCGLTIALLKHGKHDLVEAVADGRAALLAMEDASVVGGLKMPEPQITAVLKEGHDALPTPKESDPLIYPAIPKNPADITPSDTNALTPAPNLAISEKAEVGVMPLIGRDGTKPWKYYGRPMASGKGPAVAVLVTGLGLSKQATDIAFHMPPEVTLGFSSYTRDLPTWVGSARAIGHEVFLQLPVEPHDFPLSDPGPEALLTKRSAELNLKSLHTVLARAAGYVGLYIDSDEAFFGDPEQDKPIIDDLSRRGIILTFSQPEDPDKNRPQLKNAALGVIYSDVYSTEPATKLILEKQLLKAENQAQQAGVVLLVVKAYPGQLEALKEWLESLNARGFRLIPVSGLARMRFS